MAMSMQHQQLVDNTPASCTRQWFTSIQRYQSIIYTILLCVVILVLTTKNITKEDTIYLQGDMPRYLMNGVYFYDLVKDFPINNIIDYTYKYFARYPALSLGHHPFLLGIAEIPFYEIFGISVFSARLTIICFMLISGIIWFKLIKSIYDDNIAFISSLLFVTTPYIIKFSRIVMSEIFSLSFIIITIYLFFKYYKSDKNRHAFAFSFLLIMSICARYTSIFMIPIFLCYLILQKNLKKLINKNMIIVYILITILLIPIALVVLKFSQTNVQWVVHNNISSSIEFSKITHHLKALWSYHLTQPVFIMSLCSIIVSIYRRDKRAVFFLLWITIFYIQITCTPAQDSRYSMYWIPAFCLFPAVIIDFSLVRSWRILTSIALIAIVSYQFIVSYQLEPEYADGYEQAARYVTEHSNGETILFSSNVDTGFFIFFVRKYDPNKNFVVLRADKILSTSLLNRIIEDHITSREQIYEILDDFGVKTIVIEDKVYTSYALEILREEIKSEKFLLLKNINIRSNNSLINNYNLSIYEYKGHKNPRIGKELHMNIPLMGGSIKINFDDLLANRDLSKQ
jgi:hypothetical protein